MTKIFTFARATMKSVYQTRLIATALVVSFLATSVVTLSPAAQHEVAQFLALHSKAEHHQNSDSQLPYEEKETEFQGKSQSNVGAADHPVLIADVCPTSLILAPQWTSLHNRAARHVHESFEVPRFLSHRSLLI